MRSLNTNTVDGCPFDSNIFTDDVIKHIFREEFEWRDSNDSYTGNHNYNREGDLGSGCYKKYMSIGGFDIFIYICGDGIEIDQDYDCGGNFSTNFIKYDYSFEGAYDEMVEYINNLK